MKRVKAAEDEVLVRFTCTKEESERIEQCAKDAGMSKPEYIRNVFTYSGTGVPLMVSPRTYEVLKDAAKRYNLSIDGLLSTIAMKMQEFLRNFLRV